MNQIVDLQYFPIINSFVDLVNYSPNYLDSTTFFRRSSYTNRTIVLGSGGPIMLSIPIKGGRGVRCSLGEVEIDYKRDWQTNHFRTLCACYGKSPYFSFFADDLKSLFQLKPNFLVDWNLACCGWVLDKYGLKIEEIVTRMDCSSAIGDTNISRTYGSTGYNNMKNSPFLKYVQVFESKIGFYPNVSILDFLFCEGPSKLPDRD